MTWIKICGTTNLEDALTAVDAGADALGFVFYEKSPRKIDPETAGKIAAKLPASIEKVGVFVEEPVERILLTVAQAGLTAAQLHGDQYREPEFIQQLKSTRDLKVFLVVPADKISSLTGTRVEASALARFSLTQERPNCRAAREKHLIGGPPRRRLKHRQGRERGRCRRPELDERRGGNPYTEALGSGCCIRR